MTRYLTLALILAAFPLAAQTADAPWPLATLDGAAPGFDATLGLSMPGRIHGKAPCNAYSGQLQAFLPGFKIGPIAATRMACPHLAAEQRFFELLEGIEAAEQADDRLILTGGGHEMVFVLPQ